MSNSCPLGTAPLTVRHTALMVVFGEMGLSQELELQFRQVQSHIAQLSPDHVLGTPEQELVEHYLTEASVECPQLLVDQTTREPPVEFQEEIGLHGDFTPITRSVPRWTFVVPFTGDRRIFRTRPSEFSMSPPEVSDVREGELVVVVEGGPSSRKIEAAFDAQIGAVEEYLRFARRDVDQFNERLRRDVPALLSRRRDEAQRMRDLDGQIRFPIRHRGDQSVTPVPLAKRSVLPIPSAAPTGSPAVRQFVLEGKYYEETLRVLRYWQLSLERAPSIADGKGEEEIRDVLVAGLNGVFEGAAASEVFNGAGKTDILVRDPSGNSVFIGECKTWDGASSVAEALEQIFKYTTWHDTKTAIMLFIQNRDVTAVIEKVIEQIKGHENYLRVGSATENSEHNFVMHADGDVQKQIRLAFVPFALRRKSHRPGRS